MNVLCERDFQMTLPVGVTGRKFDDEAAHGLSYCMKAVDFIVELDDRILFIEFKDPDDPTAVVDRQQRFIEEFRSGVLDNKLKAKYRDSFLYEWGLGGVSKPIHYLVLIASRALSEAELVTRTDALKRQIPVLGPHDRPWKRPLVASCAVMNIKAWNRRLPQYLVTRISER